MRLLGVPLPRRTLFLTAGLLLASAGAAGIVQARKVLSRPVVATMTVERGPFVRTVEARGALKAVEATPILVPVEADGPQKVGWMARDGSHVAAGEPVVVFDATEMENTLADGRSDRNTALNTIHKQTAENRRTATGLDLDLDLVQRDLGEADQFAQKDPEIFSRNEIISSRIDREFLTTKYDATRYKRTASEKLGAADIALGEIERSKADIRIRQAEKTLGALKIAAPHDGLLVFQRNWRGEALSLGDTVFPGQKVAEIPDLAKLEARVYVLEADAGGLAPGLAARVFLEGYPGKEYTAKVSRVDAMAKTQGWKVPTKYFETILTLDSIDTAIMKPGQAIKAVVTLESLADVVSIPRGAVSEKDGKRVVYAFEDGRYLPREVSLGRSSPARVVIDKGLAAGDRIALRDPASSVAQTLKGSEAEGAGAGGGQPR